MTSEDSFFISGAIILSHEAGTCNVKRIHDIVNDRVGIGGGGTAGNHVCIKRIDSTLYKQVCNREDCILNTGRDTDDQNVNTCFFVKTDFFQ